MSRGGCGHEQMFGLVCKSCGGELCNRSICSTRCRFCSKSRLCNSCWSGGVDYVCNDGCVLALLEEESSKQNQAIKARLEKEKVCVFCDKPAEDKCHICSDAICKGHSIFGTCKFCYENEIQEVIWEEEEKEEEMKRNEKSWHEY